MPLIPFDNALAVSAQKTQTRYNAGLLLVKMHRNNFQLFCVVQHELGNQAADNYN